MTKFGDTPSTDLLVGKKFGDYLTTDDMPTPTVGTKTPFCFVAHGGVSVVNGTYMGWDQPTFNSYGSRPAASTSVALPVVGLYSVEIRCAFNTGPATVGTLRVDLFSNAVLAKSQTISVPATGGVAVAALMATIWVYSLLATDYLQFMPVAFPGVDRWLTVRQVP